MRRARGALLLALARLLAACGGGRGDDLVGVWRVVAVDGRPLPAAWPPVPGARVHAAAIAFRAAGRGRLGEYRLVLDLAPPDRAENAEPPRPGAAPLRLRDGGTYEVRGDAIRTVSTLAGVGAWMGIHPEVRGARWVARDTLAIRVRDRELRAVRVAGPEDAPR